MCDKAILENGGTLNSVPSVPPRTPGKTALLSKKSRVTMYSSF